jgi:beta-lactamase class A
MRKLFTILLYTFVMLLIGRNLSFLPQFRLFAAKPTLEKNQVALLREETKASFQKVQGNFSVYYANLRGPERFGINEREMFTAVSVNKVPIVATLYYLAAQNKLHLDERITIQENDIQDYGTGSLRYEKPGGIYTLKTLAKLAMKQSDNTAAHVLNKRLGVDLIQKTIEQFGLTQTNMEQNETTTHDMYLLYKRIYEGKITDGPHTQELLSFMQETDIEDRIPLLLPKNTAVYHKTGDGIGIIHDVGIISTGDATLFIGVLTSEMGDRSNDAKAIIGQTAKNAFDVTVGLTQQKR